MKVFIVRRNADLIEGRGPMITVAVKLELSESLKAAYKEPGVMGRDREAPAIDCEIEEWDTTNGLKGVYRVEYRWDKPTLKYYPQEHRGEWTVLTMPENWPVPKSKDA